VQTKKCQNLKNSVKKGEKVEKVIVSLRYLFGRIVIFGTLKGGLKDYFTQRNSVFLILEN